MGWKLKMVRLVESSDAGFEVWQSRIWDSYREELIRAGSSETAADEDIERNKKETFPDGKLAPGNIVFEIMHDGQAVGYVWLAVRDGEWFIYDIEINENQRGQGLGRATMRAIEEYVRASGGKKIGLSVFGFNTVAQKLYLSEGYEITRLSMSKTL